MKRRSGKTARHIALALALVIPIFLLLGYFFIGYVSLDTTLRTEAEANALFASQIIHSNPDYWRFEQIRLQEFLSRRLIRTHNEIRRIVDLNHATVAEHRDQVAYPFIMRSHHLYDSGKVVANLEIIRSLRPLLWKTFLVGFLGYLLTFTLYLWVKIFVLNPRQQAEEALKDSEERYYRRLQGLAAQLEEVQETERQRLTRELHDRVGQNLSVLGINLNLLQSLAHEGDADQIQARLDDSVALVEETAAFTRDLMADLRPPELDDYGLLEALRSHGAKFSQRTNIAVDVVGEELALRLEPSVEISLFRIIQEVLTNVAKHAQATRVRVIKEVDAGKVRLTIADNGAGFDLTRLETTKGRQRWGLITMTERAVAVGGHCRIESRPGKGTRVIVEVPR